MLPLQSGLLAVVLTYGFEMSEMLWDDHPRRRFAPLKGENPAGFPKVSIHLPICREPAPMVIETLDGLAALDYPEMEVLVIDNNTPEPELWEPVEAHCRKLGSRFRFFHLEKLPGYKAGALNFALRRTDPQAEIVAVVDSDYKVSPDWLKSLAPYFSRPGTGIVQAPQDHGRWRGNWFKTICNWE
jgi:cellulose synthase/poly-beta-1,6-N-acetylglucosamine synthase-like glycosyltransferase